MVLGLYLNVCGLYCKNPWYYQVYEDYNGIILKILCDEWVNPQILSVQSLEAHQCNVARSEESILVCKEVADDDGGMFPEHFKETLWWKHRNFSSDACEGIVRACLYKISVV